MPYQIYNPSAAPSYAGIGARKTPADVLARMSEFAARAARMGLVLRSGGADGADRAFEAGCDREHGGKAIFVPWSGFNGYVRGDSVHCGVSPAALSLAERHHPAWSRCSNWARKLHARNAHILLGPDLDEPTAFVACWTFHARAEGGTGQAIRIARACGIPVFDMGAIDFDLDKLVAFAESACMCHTTHQGALL